MRGALQRGLARLEILAGNEDGPQTFPWKNIDVPCTPSSLSRGVIIEVGGLAQEIVLSLFVRLDNFLTADDTLTVTADSDLVTGDDDRPVPVAGQPLVFRGANYVIGSASQSSPQSHVVLHLTDPNSGRK